MKAILRLRSILLGSGLALACGASATPLAATPNAPAAVGEVHAKAGPNDNTEARIKVEHLAPPGELRQPEKAYVAWVRPPGANQWQNVGHLEVDKDRSGSLNIVVPYPDFDLSVTAEQSPTTRQRGDTVVLEGHINRP